LKPRDESFKQTGTAMGKQAKLYMVRSTQGALYDVFFERGVAALAWPMLAEAAAKGFSREERPCRM